MNINDAPFNSMTPLHYYVTQIAFELGREGGKGGVQRDFLHGPFYLVIRCLPIDSLHNFECVLCWMCGYLFTYL